MKFRMQSGSNLQSQRLNLIKFGNRPRLGLHTEIKNMNYENEKDTRQWKWKRQLITLTEKKMQRKCIVILLQRDGKLQEGYISKATLMF